jgi:NTE family protein
MNMLRRGGRRPNIFQVLWRSGMVNSATATAARRRETDLLLQPQLEAVDMLNWKAFERAIDAGYSDACRRLEARPELVSAMRSIAI